jgi:iron complex transport system substrate-binding protein
MKRTFLLLPLLCLAAAVAFGQAGPVQPGTGVQAVDSLGTKLSLPRPALRVVSLSPASTETLFAIGANVVGDTTYCIYPPEAQNVAKIGGFSAKSMSIEKILSLKPDLVVSSGTIHKTVTDELARYGIPSFAYAPETFDGIASGILALGTLTGRQESARLVASTMLGKIEKVRKTLASIPADQRLTVFWEVYDEPLMTCGSSSFQHAVVEAAGGVDIFADLPGSWPRVSDEEVIKRAPQAIMGADDHGDKLTLASVAARPGWNLIPALRSKRIILLDTYLVSGPGPRIADGVLAAAKALYPRLFP